MPQVCTTNFSVCHHCPFHDYAKLQSVTLYNSEMAPAHLRGALNILFQLAITIGILVAQCINYGTDTIHPWGWRLSLGLAGVPAVIVTIGGDPAAHRLPFRFACTVYVIVSVRHWMLA